MNGDDIVWRGFTRAQLDAAYNNSGAVKNSPQKLADWQERSKRFRAAHHNELLDQRYGPRERNRIDIFRCGKASAPMLAYIHGGYWQRNAKEFYSCLAAGPLARGIDCAFIGYTLAPEATMTEITGEARAALRFLRAQAPYLGSAAKLIVSGWSAGGHLTAMVLPEADAGLAISGIYDIEPCRLNYLNDKLNMTLTEQEALSPIRRLPPRSAPLAVAYGTAELPELQRQSRDYHAARLKAKLPSELLALDGHDHFTILDELENPAGRLTETVVKLAHA
jgi:arylformamidase